MNSSPRGSGPRRPRDERLVVDEPHRPELAQVDEAQPGAVVQPKAGAEVRGLWAGAHVVEEAAGHPQVDAPEEPAVEAEEEVLSPALDVLDAAAGDLAAELVWRQELYQARRVRRDPGLGDRASDHEGQ